MRIWCMVSYTIGVNNPQLVELRPFWHHGGLKTSNDVSSGRNSTKLRYLLTPIRYAGVWDPSYTYYTYGTPSHAMLLTLHYLICILPAISISQLLHQYMSYSSCTVHVQLPVMFTASSQYVHSVLYSYKLSQSHHSWRASLVPVTVTSAHHVDSGYHV